MFNVSNGTNGAGIFIINLYSGVKINYPSSQEVLQIVVVVADVFVPPAVAAAVKQLLTG